VDWVHGSWTDSAPGSMVGRSSVSIEAAAAHGRRTPCRARGLTNGAGVVEQGKARPGDSSLRQNPRWRDDMTAPETAMAAGSWRWQCKRLGGEESEGEGVGNDGERRRPFIVAGEGHTGARKGVTAGGNGLNAIEGGAA
jgi:hypothetical protein